jgi:hypothetical protein
MWIKLDDRAFNTDQYSEIYVYERLDEDDENKPASYDLYFHNPLQGSVLIMKGHSQGIYVVHEHIMKEMESGAQVCHITQFLKYDGFTKGWQR